MSTAPIPASTTRYPGECLQPVLLRGRVDHIDDATGELLHRYTTVHEPGGVLPIACKTRRASQCPPCAEVYRADTYQLIRAGLSGGKGVPETVATHPCVFTTLTAPSFGPVHVHREKDGRLLRCRPRRRGQTCPHGRRMSCATRHRRDDTLLGEPLCPDCYDYTGAVLFNSCAPELWRRFAITLRRVLARQAGLTNKALAAQIRVSYAKVAEYQRRGVVHFHAIIRLDGPAGPTTAPPAWATVALLTAAIDQAARTVHLDIPATSGLPARTLAWGCELDTRPVTNTGELTDGKVAAYVAKYATKAAECTGTLDRRVTPADQLADLPIREHARRLIAECLRLSKLPGLEGLRLAAWAHMLGFRGHFSTKSRTYSITLGALRADRAAYQREQAIAAGSCPTLRRIARSSSPNGTSPGEANLSSLRLIRWIRHPEISAMARTGREWTTLPENDRLLTVAQAAELLGTSERFPRRLIAERRIRFVRLGESGKRGHVRIPESALREFIAAGVVEPLTATDVWPTPWRAA